VRALAVSAAVTALALAGAPDARAALAGVTGGQLVFAADAGEVNDVSIVLDGPEYRVTDTGADDVRDEPGCTEVTPQVVECAAAGVTSIGVSLFDGDDVVVIDAPVPAHVSGYGGDDTMTGGDGDDTFFGMDGADTVHGGAGDDFMLELDDRANHLDGGPGSDAITGGIGPDTVLGGPGDDVALFGGEGNDLIDGGEGDDVVDGGDGPSGLQLDSDRLVGGPGVDRVSYLRRTDPLRVSLGDGANDGAPGEADVASADFEQLRGGAGGDQLTGGPGGDVIDGGGGADVVDGGAGADRLDGGDDGAADTLDGGAGADTLEGRAGDDHLAGGDDADQLAGDDGGDRLAGGAGADRLAGGAGDDELDGGSGGDALEGGAGTDTVRYPGRAALVQVTIDGVANDGEVAVSGEGRTRIEEGARPIEGDNVDATNERVTATRSDDTVSGDGRPNALQGDAGEDFIDGAGGADSLNGGGANDAILARDGSRDRVTCGAGYDFVVADSRDLASGRAAACEYVDDGSRSAPRARRDVVVRPRCPGPRDAEISPPGTARGMPVDQRVLVPVGTAVDAYDCAVRLTAADGRGHARGGTLGGGTGRLRITQHRRAGGGSMTRLRATDCLRPGAAAGPRAVASRFRKARYRRRYGRIAFPAEVRVDAAVMTKRSGVATWSVDDRCGRSATISVTSGRLAVLDLGTDRRVVLGRGDRFVATAP